MSQKSHKLWQGRSSGEVSDITVEIGESISLDIELYREDIQGSRAHARMLQRIGVLNDDELKDILRGLDQVAAEIEAGEMPLQPELEDIHTHVENRLGELIGGAAKKLHTARSRNDQVALDTHLFVRRASSSLGELCVSLARVLLKRSEESVDIILPGYTHLQVGQPVRLSHHLLAHMWSFLRDAERFQFSAAAADRLPLGSGAMAGVNYPVDREFVQAELQFASIYPNSMEAVASRDHIANFLFACSNFMVHASRICEEIILWNSQEFSFIALPDRLTTGSSIMPQKKNPDLAELVRGKSGRVLGLLQSLLVSTKGLPFTYNRDLQEDRFPLLDAHRQCHMSALALKAMVAEMTFNPERMRASLEQGFAQATDLADALVQQRNVAFRDAHHLVGALVARCVDAGIGLTSAGVEMRAQVSEHFADEQFYQAAVDLAGSTDKKVSYGGTARTRQTEQLAEARAAIEALADPAAWPLNGKGAV